MVNCQHIIFGLLVLQIYVSAAPSNITTVEELPQDKELTETVETFKVDEPKEVINEEHEEPKLDSKPSIIEDSKLENNSMQSLRQKRFYNFYGVPPVNPIVYPSYNKRDQSAETGVYGLVDDPLDQIQRRLHDIASLVRQPAAPPPPPVHFPFFFPVIYIPYGCDCNTKPNEQPKPQDPQTPTPENNQTNPDINNRIPVLEDERQNWGLIANESDTEYDEDEFSRPISFDPIESDKPLSRPAPPLDHGSSQDGQMTTVRPPSADSPMNPPRQPPASQERPSSQGRPATGQIDSSPYPASFSPNIPRGEQPSTCDSAVLSCCHQERVTYDCFVLQGCPDPTSYGNPCDPLVILRVIDKFQRFYGVRNG